MKAGAEPKKIAILAALLIVAAIILYFNVFSGDSVPSRPVTTLAPVVTAPAGAAGDTNKRTVDAMFSEMVSLSITLNNDAGVCRVGHDGSGRR